MSNILIIKHGSLGDLIQANGAIKDIKKFWEDHTVAIKKFKRYPHRNEILGRESTKEEIEFLKGPNSSW